MIRRRLFPYFLLNLMFVLVFILIRLHRKPTISDLIYKNNINNLSCHYNLEGDALPLIQLQMFEPLPKSIFFHETACRGKINSRQLCSIESAARLHPDREVYVLFSGPMSKAEFQHFNILKQFTNVHVGRILITNYAKNTPLEDLINEGILNNTLWGIENTSNVLRFLTLYKWSGVYLDMDIVVVKSFNYLPDNWIAKQDNLEINCAAMSLSDDEEGRGMAFEFVNEVSQTYNPNIWIHNGPGVVTRVLSHICDNVNVSMMSRMSCQGFPVLKAKYIYPIHYTERHKYFEQGNPEDTPEAFTHHIWNRLTHIRKIPKKSLYAKLAEKFCPIVHKFYGVKFGT